MNNLYDENTASGRVFVSIIEISVILVFLHALLNSVGGTEPFGLYNRIYFGKYDLHRLTVLCISASFYLHWRMTKYLYPIKRFVVNLTITSWYTYFGGVLWTTFSVIYRQQGFWYLPYLGLVFISSLLFALNKKSAFFKMDLDKNGRNQIFLLFMVQIGAYVALGLTGFWEALNLSDAGLGPDPNINIFWTINRLVSFFILVPFISRYDIRAPYAMNPEVF